MKKITRTQLKKILADHAEWLRNWSTGARADLSRANLSGADLSGANLSGADLDFGQWPLWCGSLKTKVDERLARQLCYHALAVSEQWFKPTKKQLDWVNKFHRIPEVPELK